MGAGFPRLVGSQGASGSGGVAQGAGGPGLHVGQQATGFSGAAEQLGLELPPGAIPQPGLPVGATGGVQGHGLSEEEQRGLFYSIFHQRMTVDGVREGLAKCPGLVLAKNNDDHTLLLGLFVFFYDHPKLLEIATLLVEKGALLNVQDRWGLTPLHQLLGSAATHPQLLQTAKLLVHGGARLDVQNSQGFTPLYSLLEQAYEHPQLLEIVTLLIQHGPYPDDALRQRIDAKIQTALEASPPHDANQLVQHQNLQDQARACQQALALCPYGYLQTAIGLGALKEHIDACAPENIHEPAPGSVYPPLWHAVAHGDVEALMAIFDKMRGLDFGVCLPGSSVTLGQFLGRLEGGQIVAPKHALEWALFCYLYNVDTLVLENYLNLNRYQGKDDPQYQSDVNCLRLFHALASTDADKIAAAIDHLGGLKLEVCLPNSQIKLGEFLIRYANEIPQTWIAIAVAFFQHIRSTVTLEQLNAYLDSDSCSQENINDAMPYSPYSPLWHAVAHAIDQGDDSSLGTLRVVTDKDGLDFMATLPNTNITLAEFLASLRNSSQLGKKMAEFYRKLEQFKPQ